MSHAFNRNSEQTAPRRSRGHMLKETQEFLSRNLSMKAKAHPPGYRPDDDKAHRPRPTRHDRRRKAASEVRAGNASAPTGTLISVPSNEHGHVDRAHLAALVDRLFPLTSAYRRDDVLLDLTNVTSVTTTFVKVAEAFRRYLAQQDRSVFLFDVNRPGGSAMEMRDLNRLVQRPHTIDEFEHLFARQLLPAFLAKVFD